VAIFDATNTTKDRRKLIADRIRQDGCQVVFIECIAEDPGTSFHEKRPWKMRANYVVMNLESGRAQTCKGRKPQKRDREIFTERFHSCDSHFWTAIIERTMKDALASRAGEYVRRCVSRTFSLSHFVRFSYANMNEATGLAALQERVLISFPF
jgi:hypothetical protein